MLWNKIVPLPFDSWPSPCALPSNNRKEKAIRNKGRRRLDQVRVRCFRRFTVNLLDDPSASGRYSPFAKDEAEINDRLIFFSKTNLAAPAS